MKLFMIVIVIEIMIMIASRSHHKGCRAAGTRPPVLEETGLPGRLYARGRDTAPLATASLFVRTRSVNKRLAPASACSVKDSCTVG